MVITDKRVVKNVILAMKVSSPPCSTHSIVPDVATGMAEMITASPNISGLMPGISINKAYITSGVTMTLTIVTR